MRPDPPPPDAGAPRRPLDQAPPRGADEPPPLGGSWGRLYAVVLVTLAVLVGLFSLLTWAYR